MWEDTEDAATLLPACDKLKLAWPAQTGDEIPSKRALLAVGLTLSCVIEHPLTAQYPDGTQAAGVL